MSCYVLRVSLPSTEGSWVEYLRAAIDCLSDIEQKIGTEPFTHIRYNKFHQDSLTFSCTLHLHNSYDGNHESQGAGETSYLLFRGVSWIILACMAFELLIRAPGDQRIQRYNLRRTRRAPCITIISQGISQGNTAEFWVWVSSRNKMVDPASFQSVWSVAIAKSIWWSMQWCCWNGSKAMERHIWLDKKEER